MEQNIQSLFNKSLTNLEKFKNNYELIKSTSKAVELITDSIIKLGCLYCAGNGGSAADSQHFVAEFISRLSQNRDPIRAISLTVDTSVITAIGNDFGFENIFARQIDAIVKKNDIFFAISTSAKSKNILLALEKAKNKKISTILLTGEKINENFKNCDVVIKAPGLETGNIQESHLIIYHSICFMVEKKLIEKGFINYN